MEVLKEGIPIRNSKCVTYFNFLYYYGSPKEIQEDFQKSTLQMIFKILVQAIPVYS